MAPAVEARIEVPHHVPGISQRTVPAAHDGNREEVCLRPLARPKLRLDLGEDAPGPDLPFLLLGQRETLEPRTQSLMRTVGTHSTTTLEPALS